MLHRMQVRIDEVNESIGIIRAALPDDLPGGSALCAGAADPARPLRAERRGRLARRDLALDSHRRRTTAWSAARSKTLRCNNWPALVEAVQGNIIADFPVINKSFNLSYSGTDR